MVVVWSVEDVEILVFDRKEIFLNACLRMLSLYKQNVGTFSD
jgi:hypothetical protein